MSENLGNVAKKQAELRQIAQEIHRKTYEIQVEVLDGGKMPFKAHQSDAGFDLFATEDITVVPGQVVRHPLNIRFGLPDNCWAEITSKSGLGSKGLLVFAGVIDSGYTGIPHVVATNLKHVVEVKESGEIVDAKPLVIKKGEKLAQLIMSPYSENFYMVQVDKVSKVSDRGAGGFGSTGK